MSNVIIKASFARCSIPHRQAVFKQSNCIMPISVGQGLQVHEGKKFAATIALINASFKACTLLIDDTVQHHTMKIFSQESEETLYEKALQEGNEWLERNKKAYTSLKINYKIMRWNDWLTHSDYLVYYKIVSDLYNSNINYKMAVQSTVNEYLSRNSERLLNSGLSTQKANDFCVAYLLEECAVMCLWAQEGYDFEVYPSGRSAAMQATSEFVIMPKYPNKIISVSVRFKKYYKN